MIRRTLLLCLAVSLGLAASPKLFAHAVLLGSNPAADQVLDTAPEEIVLNFNENVGPIFIRVLDLNGAEVGNAGEWRVEGNDVFLPLGETLPNGTYILTYRVISADTHPVGATFVFAIGEPITDASAVASADSGSTAWTWVVALNRLLLYGSVLLAAGSALLLLLMSLSENSVAATTAQGRIAAIVALVTYFLAIGFGGAEMVLGGPGALFSAGAWSQAMGSTLVPSAVIGIPRRPDSAVRLPGFCRRPGSTTVVGRRGADLGRLSGYRSRRHGAAGVAHGRHGGRASGVCGFLVRGPAAPGSGNPLSVCPGGRCADGAVL